MSEKARVTLRDIARRANVSVSTVSRALNDHEYVNEATRHIVQQAAASLGYPLNNLRTVQLPTTATIIGPPRPDTPRSSNDFEFLAIEGARDEFEGQNIQVAIRRLGMNDRDMDEIWADSGVVWIGGVVDLDFVAEMQQRQMPFVLVGGHVLPVQVNVVMADYAYGMEAAVDHLVARGKQQIGFINGPNTTTTSDEKYNGVCVALFRHGLPFAPHQLIQVVDGWFDVETGYRKTNRLLNQFADVDAIIYAGDNMAMGGLRALKEGGYRIPDDIAVVGCHNYEVSRFTDPALTTVGFDIQEMGRMAVRRLRAIIDGDVGNWTLLAPTALIVRDSS